MSMFDRDRPYDGQRHTFVGQRGKYSIISEADFVDNLTMRDIFDCMLIGMLRAYGVDPENVEEVADLYQRLDLNGANFDPVAAAQNSCCEIETRLGIYPNVPKED
jgi:hypothetical protein